ncbi:hypothetical protein ETB97_009062 [Aspergillus alliaceus]|uniref:Uncharacterized protein n=1 Tax=Petromyces alliaceus TaxID=209559 RepID=A0A8H6EAN3_PETAA|nr:hypothetical protein ETB97_009062 [Aspergillus burnettii]
MAATLVLFFKSMGQTIGVTIGGSILENQLPKHLSAVVSKEATSQLQAQAKNLVSLGDLLRRLPTASSEATEIRQALVNTFQDIWVVMCGFAGLNLILSIFTKEFDMNQSHETEQGFVHTVHNTATENKSNNQ